MNTRMHPQEPPANPADFARSGSALDGSLRFQQALLNAVGQAVIATDLGHRVIYWNRFAEVLYGWTGAEVVGQRLIALMRPADVGEAADSILQLVRSGRSWSGQFPVRRKDGVDIPVFVVLSPIIEDGEITGIVGVSRDFSAEKEAEEVLRKSEERYRALVSAVPDLIFRMDGDFKFIDYAGPAAALITPVELMLGRHMRDILPREVAARFEDAVRRALRTGRPTPIEYPLEIGGSSRVYEALIAPSGTREVIATVREITQRKRDHEMLERLLQDLESRVADRTRDVERANAILTEQIDKRIRAEETALANYVHLQALLDAVPAAIVEFDARLLVVTWTGSAEKMFGWSAAEATGRNIPALPVGELSNWSALNAIVAEHKVVQSVPMIGRHKDGRLMNVTASVSPVRGSSGEVERFVVVYLPVVENMREHIESLAQNARELQSLSRAATRSLDLDDAMGALAEELQVAFGIRSGALLLCDAAESRIRYAWGDVFRDAQDFSAMDSDEVDTVAEPQTGRMWLRAQLRRASASIGVLLLQTPADAVDARLDFLRAVAHEAASAIINAYLHETVMRANDELQRLSRQLVAVQEDERRDIGRELHDQIGQMLTALKLSLAAVRGGESRGDAIADAEQIATDLLQQVRDLSLELRPPMLDDMGLVAALTWHVERFAKRSGILVNLRHGQLARFDPEIETAAFRIVQEAMTNTVRHAGATHVSVRAWTAGERLFVEIIDDGRGFALRTDGDGASGGLRIMRERATLAGGSLTIESQPDHGTCITVDLPVRREAVSDADDHHR